MATVVSFDSPRQVLAFLNSITLPSVYAVIDKGSRYTIIDDLGAGSFAVTTHFDEDKLLDALAAVTTLIDIVPKKEGGKFTFVSVSDVVGGSNSFSLKVTNDAKDLEDFLNDPAVTVEKIIEHDTKKLVIFTDGGPSAEVQAVFDRMAALTQTEKDAIETYVDGLVSDGAYSDISEIYAPCLNDTDFLIGFKFMTLEPGPTVPVHTAGQYVEFSSGSMRYLDSANFDTFATPEGFAAVYNVFTDADTTGNADLFGLATAGIECYMRWRGNDTNDFNSIYNVTSATPRSAANQRPTGDLVGMGLEGSDLFVLQPGGIIVKATRTPTAVPASNRFQWHGQNIDGTPSAGNVANSRYSLMIHSNGLLSSFAQGVVRTRSLQFLIDIGVTGVPIP